MGTMAKEFFIGTSGWNYDHWRRRFYPGALAKREWFHHYAQYFSTVEVNYSFYRWPRPETVDKWSRQAPAGFRYTLKAPRTITHVKRLKGVGPRIDDFYELTSRLGRAKGCHLFQLPPSFAPSNENFERLRRLARALDGHKDNAVEFRDSEWWAPKTYDLLESNNVSFCVVSGLDMPDTVVVTGDVAYFRFHGEGYSSEYSENEIEKYARLMSDLKCRRVYAYFNNDARAFAVKNALRLKEVLGA